MSRQPSYCEFPLSALQASLWREANANHVLRGARLYRTGDLVRQREDGALELAGCARA